MPLGDSIIMPLTSFPQDSSGLLFPPHFAKDRTGWGWEWKSCWRWGEGS